MAAFIMDWTLPNSDDLGESEFCERQGTGDQRSPPHNGVVPKLEHNLTSEHGRRPKAAILKLLTGTTSAGWRMPIYGASIALIAALLLAQAKPAWAQGSNTSAPLPAPPTPAAVTPSTTQQLVVGQGGCAQQYTGTINFLNTAGIITGYDGALAGVDTDTALAGFAIQEIGFSQQAGAVYLTDYTSGISKIDAGIINASFPVSSSLTPLPPGFLNGYPGLPNCDANFAGTVAVTAGGVNVSGDSIFNNSVAFARNASVTGTLSASQMTSSQGISAFGGKITIGDPNRTAYSSGITIGGGALSGAGTGGLEAFTGDPTAIAIGNNAQAAQAGSLALGLNSDAAGASATALGDTSAAFADKTVAVGAGAVVMPGAGQGSLAGATSIVLGGVGAVAIGDSDSASGTGAIALGDPNVATGTGAVAVGANNTATGQGAVAIGNLNTATGQGAVAIGDQNTATGPAAIAEGQGSTATATNSTAIGAGATVAAGDTNSTAIGPGATTTVDNQIVLGTRNQTYTAPGLDSALSRSRQSGRLGVVTVDPQGNLASDNGYLFQQVAIAKAGVAAAMAMSDPFVSGSRKVAIKLSLANFDGADAMGFSAAGMLGTGLLTRHDELVASASVGWGHANAMGYSASPLGASVSVQYSW